MLVCSGVLAVSMPLVYGAGRATTPGGNRWSLGNRDATLAVAPWVERAQRAHANLVENLPTFAILVLVAHVTLAANELTAIGATVFFAARLAHAITYVAGIIYLRTLLFFVSIAGEALILLQLFA
jgi:uncharacterized MAPEG superfamily protein